MFPGKNFQIPFRVAAVLFIICIPLLLLSGNIRWVANDLQFYKDSFQKYDVSRETGFSDAELIEISEGLIRYLNTGAVDDTMDVFSEDDIAHLRDVRGLIQLSYIIQWSTLGYIVVFVAAGFAYGRKRFCRLFAMWVAAGSVVGIIGIAVIGLAALIDFDWLFIAFHRVFFTNDLWVSSGYLPRIYTEGFFYDAAKFIAIATVLESALIGAVAGLFILRLRKRLTN
jgi:integral membrane protein (TIGR01906 family)